MHYNDCTAPPIFAFFACILQLQFLKCIQIFIIGCKLATTEYGAETFFQSQLVNPVFLKWSLRIEHGTPNFFDAVRSFISPLTVL